MIKEYIVIGIIFICFSCETNFSQRRKFDNSQKFEDIDAITLELANPIDDTANYKYVQKIDYDSLFIIKKSYSKNLYQEMKYYKLKDGSYTLSSDSTYKENNKYYMILTRHYNDGFVIEYDYYNIVYEGIENSEIIKISYINLYKRYELYLKKPIVSSTFITEIPQINVKNVEMLSIIYDDDIFNSEKITNEAKIQSYLDLFYYSK